jgi:hypothetical protein
MGRPNGFNDSSAARELRSRIVLERSARMFFEQTDNGSEFQFEEISSIEVFSGVSPEVSGRKCFGAFSRVKKSATVDDGFDTDRTETANDAIAASPDGQSFASPKTGFWRKFIEVTFEFFVQQFWTVVLRFAHFIFKLLLIILMVLYIVWNN